MINKRRLETFGLLAALLGIALIAGFLFAQDSQPTQAHEPVGSCPAPEHPFDLLEDALTEIDFLKCFIVFKSTDLTQQATVTDLVTNNPVTLQMVSPTLAPGYLTQLTQAATDIQNAIDKPRRAAAILSGTEELLQNLLAQVQSQRCNVQQDGLQPGPQTVLGAPDGQCNLPRASDRIENELREIKRKLAAPDLNLEPNSINLKKPPDTVTVELTFNRAIDPNPLTFLEDCKSITLDGDYISAVSNIGFQIHAERPVNCIQGPDSLLSQKNHKLTVKFEAAPLLAEARFVCTAEDFFRDGEGRILIFDQEGNFVGTQNDDFDDFRDINGNEAEQPANSGPQLGCVEGFFEPGDPITEPGQLRLRAFGNVAMPGEEFFQSTPDTITIRVRGKK